MDPNQFTTVIQQMQTQYQQLQDQFTQAQQRSQQEVQALQQQLLQTQGAALQLHQAVQNMTPQAHPPAPSQGSKVNKPKVFDGADKTDPNSVENFVYAMELYFQAAHIDPADQLATASSFCTGPALALIRSSTATLTNWDSLKQVLRAQFTPVNLSATIRDKLERLRQTTSVQQYTYQFQLHAIHDPTLTEQDKKRLFIKGLKPNLQLLTTMKDDPTTTFAALTQYAERLDTVAYQAKSTLLSGPRQEMRKQNIGRPFPGPQPMDLDAAEITEANALFARSRLTSEEKQKLMRNNGCFFCRKENVSHRASNCPNKQGKGQA
jgi:hypothetical protein